MEKRNWYLKLKTGEEIHLTDSEGRVVYKWRNEKSPNPLDVYDEFGALHQITRQDVTKLKMKALTENRISSPSQYVYYCHYGHAHEDILNCNHWKKYGISPVKFWDKIKEKWDIQYEKQITPEMRAYALK